MDRTISRARVVAAAGMLVALAVALSGCALFDGGAQAKPAARHKGMYKGAKVSEPADLLGPWPGKPDYLKNTLAWRRAADGRVLAGKSGAKVGDLAGDKGAEFTAYSASKAGIHGLARTVAAAYASDNIRVNTVVPAYTETTLVATISSDPESRKAIVGRIPLGRAGTPHDVEGIMMFLASDDGAFATGSLFAVDGGMTTL